MSGTDTTPGRLTPIPPLRIPRAQWRRGLRAVRELIQNADDTEKAQDVSLAIGQHDEERRFQRFAASAEGQRLLREAPCLLTVLSDRAALEALGPDSFGRAYLAYMCENGFEARSLVALRRRAQARWEAQGHAPPLDPARTWFRDRLMLCHDLLHVVTGYGTDGVGEATLLAFSMPQFRNRATSFLTFGAVLEVGRFGGLAWFRYAADAWRRGRRAEPLLAQPWEELLPVSLCAVRERLGVGSPSAAHPGGVLVGEAGADGRMRVVAAA